MNSILNGQFLTIVKSESQTIISNIEQVYIEFKSQVREIINQTNDYSTVCRFFSDITEALMFYQVGDKKKRRIV